MEQNLVSEDVERAAFQYDCPGYYDHTMRADKIGYEDPETERAFKCHREGVKRGRAAAVKPVQDAVLPVPLSKAIYLLTERLRKSTLMLEKESRNGHPRHHKNTVAKNWSAIADSVDLMNAFLAAPIASTGNTEEHCTYCGKTECMQDKPPCRMPSTSSPLSEEKAVEVMAEALRIHEIDWITGEEDTCQLRAILSDYQTSRLAKAAYRAIAPHLSDTSAEKARVDGLVAFAQQIASEGFYGAMNDPNDLVKILDEHKDGADKALAAFEKGA